MREVDHYRVTLFKKKLRKILGGHSWIRFYFSSGGTHLTVTSYHVGEENLKAISYLLNKAGIEVIKLRNPFGLYSDHPEDDQPLWCLSIPIDQPALPERKQNKYLTSRVLVAKRFTTS